jgi:hypothetical protein
MIRNPKVNIYVSFSEYTEEDREFRLSCRFSCLGQLIEKVFYENESQFLHPEIHIFIKDMRSNISLTEFIPPLIANPDNYIGIGINKSGVQIVEKNYYRKSYTTSLKFEVNVNQVRDMFIRANSLKATANWVRNWYDVVWIPSEDMTYLCPRFVAELMQVMGFLSNVKPGAIQADNIYQLLEPYAILTGEMVIGQIY